ncbi:MAG: hypothetical protein FWE74_08185 [Oscillospiraceae bacterium]|nr:hypothetical protein [Oscillospiraceae bacterium]
MKKKILIIIITAVLITAAAVLFFLRERLFSNVDIPSQITITVAWNPGSVADDIARVVSGDMDTQVILQNITGANGANGLNAVFNAPHDGTNLLSTSLSAFLSAEPMGFADSKPDDWTWWLVAFSPAVIVVAADSPYESINELGNLVQADTSSGSSPAVNAVLRGEADFAELLRVEVIHLLNSGELRVLETLDFGEHYGLFVPAGVPADRLSGLENLIESAVASEAFAVFLNDNGLLATEFR